MATALLGSFESGIIFSLMALGVYLTFRILNFPDLTVDGSFTTGGAMAAAMIVAGYSPLWANLVAVIAGCVAGMATFTQPKILLLDEHTAALDPARAELITQLTKSIVEKSKLTTLMVTHNMKQAIDLGNRLIMMDKGRIILDVPEANKKNLTIEGLLKEFERFKGVASDRVLLG